ncbi:hypothetical protein CCM_06026 [Cordyceps militaris CM01]|uniref:Uncharacterized protein n=2 Tax=Cordyceps militaris TaxID=73501 RepID=G3JIB9_CORMM|nr:uncharacterized protein CCM_06026 [Cordyceps militaris CM01]ATY58765.1 hypothetical protein A9K55_003390 [Cordyceps militaris]EGX91869.1 hypothetical protein CCM_06026 [Cordyceps militaris CM01]
MIAPFGTSKRSSSSHTLLPDLEKAEAVHVETVEAEEEASSPLSSADLTSDQVRALVLDAFDSASCQLHSAPEEGILEPIAPPPAAEMVNRGSGSGPRSPRLVEIKTNDAVAEPEAAPKEKPRLEEPQKADRGSFIYVPGLGFLYQDDDMELGK